ncbi:hypothetical protein NDU88_004717 [Pleurodeles waltl]|uniref:Uncharacterized protein n=1 Tax=Pleurodeles waltl TaxID=8319 RepID=A0AAV7SJK7_PLEWA|nr:hypothetical protein NDU88_004717 [Pleurodeles waltl]
MGRAISGSPTHGVPQRGSGEWRKKQHLILEEVRRGMGAHKGDLCVCISLPVEHRYSDTISDLWRNAEYTRPGGSRARGSFWQYQLDPFGPGERKDKPKLDKERVAGTQCLIVSMQNGCLPAYRPYRRNHVEHGSCA